MFSFDIIYFLQANHLSHQIFIMELLDTEIGPGTLEHEKISRTQGLLSGGRERQKHVSVKQGNVNTLKQCGNTAERGYSQPAQCCKRA